jgi:hypothetical protein
MVGALMLAGARLHADCVTPANPVEAENCLPGHPPSEWEVTGAGDASIQGFAADMSVNRGGTAVFKVNTDAASYVLDIYRLGYYGGDGARKVATVTPSATLPQSQPACLTDSTGLVDCGNWAVSASWPVPADAVSGIYLARLLRTNGGASHIVFVVRDDGGTSDLLFQTADTTWQAYNRYGGNSLYQGTGPGGGLSGVGRAYKVSYNRPFTTRDYADEDFFFNSEYPMVRWLERNGYDVSYFSGVDSDRLGAEIARHKVFLSVGHDEYWSGPQRANVEAARDGLLPGQTAPVHLAFFGGNDVFWKTRFEPSISASATPHRTLVCYKETHEGANIDPSPEWTGTWRDSRPINTEGANPENALTGTIFTVNCCTYPLELRLPDSQMRFWRNTPNVSQLTGSQVWTGPAESLGYEWNEDLDNGSRPPGLVRLSTTTRNVPERIQDHGSTYGAGTATHSLTLHQRPGGALVFSAGTVQWSWGLDSTHDRGNDSPSPDMQQATVNLFADMGVQPASLDPLLLPAVPSTDVAAPTSLITSPANNANVPVSVPLTIQGTANDATGRVGGVEVSVDGGASWRRAAGHDTWSFLWTPPQNGTFVIRSRAVDDSANLENPGPGITVTVGSGPPPPPPPTGGITVFGGSGTPALVNQNDGQALGLGMKFRSSVAGHVVAIRFYKGDEDGGTHVGRLWTAAGTVLATATFSGETASGWQEVALPSPVAINPGTTYVASYHSSAGYYVVTDGYFTQAVVNGPLTALASGTDGANGVYRYGASAFPNVGYQQSNFWVDVVFVGDSSPPTVGAVSPAGGASGVPAGASVTATFSEPLAAGTVNATTVELRDPAAQLVAGAVTWDPATRTATLDPASDLAFSTAYTATIRGGTGGVTDLMGNPMAADYGWTFTTEAAPPPDTTPPTVTSMSPLPGAAGVLAGANVTATFSEALDPATVGATTVQLRNPAAQLVAAAVTWNPAARTATLDPAADLVYSSTYTATVRGGVGGVTDLAGNALAADVAWTFTTQPAPPPITSIWAGAGNPTFPNADDGQPLEIGVKFRSSVPGHVTAIRFYKGNLNTGVHVGSLWSATGSRLATATFTNETPSGWQEVALPSPVAITAGTTYVASYHSAGGVYALTEGYFTQAVVNGPLTALADGAGGGNGVFRYGASAFPDEAYLQSNYWVDVVFSAQPPGPDTTPPAVVATIPADGSAGVFADANASARFSEALDPATVDGSTVQLRDAAAQVVPATVAWDATTTSAVLDPSATLAYSSTYTVTVLGGASGVTDVAGNPLAADVTWTFTTQAAPPPPPEEGPGGPILVISHSANRFSRYYAEILRAEGLNAFESLDISVVDASVLSGYDVAILGEMPLTPAQVALITGWVQAGGNLIAMRPDAQLAGLLGLADTPNTLAEGYLLVDTAAAPGQGIVGQTIQFHGMADRYALAGATAVATLYANATTATTNPAVTMRAVGSGTAAAFTYDLARSVVYTRQGNPAWAGEERDGTPPIRSDDLFYGAKAGNVLPDWVNLNKVAIPQADEQQRLFANLILHVNRDRKPLPRFWYFPYGKKAVVVMTSDNHGNGGSAAARLDRQRSQDPPGCDVSRWECVRSSVYVFLTPFTGAAALEDQGFEIGVHVNTGCADYTPESLEDDFSAQLGEFGTLPQFAGVAPPATNRTHCIAWSDWASQATVSLAHGIRLDTNYYYWPGTWVANRPGHFTGSGMPMRFAGLDGSLIDVYQAATQITDESGQAQPFTIDTLLDRALGAEGYYGAITANIHSDSGDDGLSDLIVGSAQSRNVPVISARQLLTWLDGRNGSSFGAIQWSADALTFTIAVGAGASGLEAMLPTRADGARMLTALTRDGSPVPYSLLTVKGVEYAFFAADPGAYQASYPLDLAPPAISALSALVGSNGTATIQWLTDERATSVVEYGTQPSTLDQVLADPLFVTSHGLVLGGLSADTTYYFRVRSVDPLGNSAASAVDSFHVTIVDTTPPSVTLVRPAGGERVFAGTPYILQWTASDDIGVTGVDAAFSADGGASFTPIAECTGLPGNAQTCAWTAPSPTTTQGRIRVTARDEAGHSGSALSSANVTVASGAASLTLTAPNTAVSWRIGNIQSITFNHNLGTGQQVAVDISRDAGASWTTANPSFVTTSSTAGSVPWTVTGPPTASARARVRWSGNPAVASASAVNFNVIDRISVTAPNTAVTWPTGSTRSISWSHNLGVGATVNIDLSRDGGASWTSVAAGVASGGATTGSYSWVVTGPATTAARIRVTSVADPSIAGTSAVNFTISGTITVTAPTGSSVWSVGSERTVTWNHTLGAGQAFDILLSTDNGGTYPTTIAAAVPGGSTNGSYTWVVPGPLTATARVRVRWTSATGVSAQSGAFDMVNPSITVTAPNTAVTWAVGSTRNITFSHNLGVGAEVNVDVSRNGGATYAPLFTFTTTSATAGTVPWEVTGPATTEARIRVGGLGAADASNVNFTVQ